MAVVYQGGGVAIDSSNGQIVNVNPGSYVPGQEVGASDVYFRAPNQAAAPPNPSGPSTFDSVASGFASFFTALAPAAATVSTAAIAADAARRAGTRSAPIVVGGAAPKSSSLGPIVLVGGLGVAAAVLYWILKK